VSGKNHRPLDIIIRGGRVIEGTGNPWVWADVGVKDGRIVGIGRLEPNDADRVIDADGRVVCPGFIEPPSSQAYKALTDGEFARIVIGQRPALLRTCESSAHAWVSRTGAALR
jgi:N-acyl-D-aspartate/D-glutamate deacylase